MGCGGFRCGDELIKSDVAALLPVAQGFHVGLVFRAQGRAVTQKLFEHGNLVAALGATRAGAVNTRGFLHRDLEMPMRVRAKLLKQCIQLGLELRTGTGAAHRPLHAHLEGDFFELFTVLVLAVVCRVHQLVGEGVNDLKRAGERG